MCTHAIMTHTSKRRRYLVMASAMHAMHMPRLPSSYMCSATQVKPFAQVPFINHIIENADHHGVPPNADAVLPVALRVSAE